MSDSDSDSDSTVLYCSEVMEASPLSNESTGSIGAVSPKQSRIAYTAPDENLHGSRALMRKLEEQGIPLNLESWGAKISVRRNNWIHAMGVYIKHNFSQSSLQLAISLMDRFIKRYRQVYNGSLDKAPLEFLFDGAVTIAEQMADDAPEYTLRKVYESPLDGVPRRHEEIQVAMKLILQVTDWEVIDWTPASFVPHFLEAVQLGSDEALHSHVLSVSTMFVLDEIVCAYVHPSAIAALAVGFQAWVDLDDGSGSVKGVASVVFFQRVIQTLTDVGRMHVKYFVEMADFVLSRCLVNGWHTKFPAIRATAFALLMKTFFGAMPLLEAASANPKPVRQGNQRSR
ncbi:uncharacterized protein LOC129589381 [Paramacrobiotus metropolitanus]|uniref:uncharacterized protein LOC129589381 n=1 Tax=Paramacrobiotus metropolitanus TaxID=2943436 RepID=UPI002445B87B|nr:uncharacterized protein LOC129589381 [Paramacrobiotus metropolitanus]